jgi:protein SCO1/2
MIEMVTQETLTGEPEKAKRSSGQWFLLAGLILAAMILFYMLAKPIKVMPFVAEVPTYILTDQNGESFNEADLVGKVVIYDFVYTHCTTVCPAMTGTMLQFQRRFEEAGLLGDAVELVTITFDPVRDTAARLREYAREVNADPEHWHWLTGSEIAIKQLVGGEFGVYFEQIPLDEAAADAAGLTPEERANGYDFVHAVMFVLVDGDGNIRAEYQQMPDVDQVMRDTKLVVREQNANALLRLVYKTAHLIQAYP